MDSGLDRNETRNARMRCTVFAIHNRRLFLLLEFLAGVRVVDLPSNKPIVVFADLLLSTAGTPSSKIFSSDWGELRLERNGSGSLHPRTVIQ